MAADGAVAVDDHTNSHPIATPRRAETRVNLAHQYEVAKPEPAQPIAAPDHRVEQLDVEIAAPDGILAEARADQGAGHKVGNRHDDPAVFDPQPHPTQEIRGAVRRFELRPVHQPQAQSDAGDLHPVADP